MKNPLFALIFLVPLFQILLSIDVVLVSGQCLESQRTLLLQLKSSLTFDSSHSTKLVFWNQSRKDCCNWEGVTCNTSTGQITGLDLSLESITNGINGSSALFSLQFLQKLNLAYNNFASTQIPSGIFNLTSLTYLNLSNSGFVGQIPDGFSRLNRLVVLDLSTLYFPGLISLKLEKPNLSMLVQNLPKLAELYLDGVNISSQGYTWSQAISSSLPNLRELSMSNSYITGPIDSSLEKLQSLSLIRLDKNELNASVPEFLANMPNLTVLSLSSCNLNGMFPESILKLPTLKVLDLSYNKLLEGSLLASLPPNGSLCTLVLSITKFSGALPDSIGNIRMVSRMELNNCNFSGKIPTSMANLNQLVHLDFSYNKFTGNIPSFKNSKSLTHLDFSQNELSGAITSSHFEGLVNLTNIDLRFNAFNGSIPSSLFALPSLRKIQLSNNQFNGLLPNFSSGFPSQLDTLDLSSNNLIGLIPASLFELKRLNILDLSLNKLTGVIHLETIWGLGNLTSLDLSYNRLSIKANKNSSVGKSLYPQLSTLKLASCKLQKFPNLENQLIMSSLDLSDNLIQGEIPNWIWNIGNGNLMYLNLSHNLLVNLQKPYAISHLSILDLHSNLLTGKIPIPPITSSYVDYSANHFSSSIPPNIGNNLNVAYFVSISSNNLSGNIPDSICNASYLQVLDLSTNGFSGMIPPCLLELSSLAVLNLGNNSLNGSITATFGRNCSLRTLDLHANHLEGKVPQSLANCTDLEVLNLGNNQINDTFSCFLKNSSNLRVLVLRSNMFHGDIRCTMLRSHWPNLQIIDIASNYFTGKVPQHCFLNWTRMMGGEKDDEQLTVNHLAFGVLWLSGIYYQDTVTVTSKGLEVTLVKILTIFNSVDISNNMFEGDIPETVGKLKALYLLNLSHNALTGSIPSSLGNLKQLEALDLSVNKLSGPIPPDLSKLNFLSFLNLSNNWLTGKIPTGSQFQTFSENSFKGNQGLCGIQLNKTCGGDQSRPSSEPNDPEPDSSPSFDWQFMFTGSGFGVGAAIVVVPLMFLKGGICWWDECIDQLLIMILPKLGITFNGYYDQTVEVDDDTEEEPPDSEQYSDNDEGVMVHDQLDGRYCVFCSKIDMVRNNIVHNPKCNCHSSTTPLYSS